MAKATADICVVTKTYGGLEGRRVYAGTRFAIDKAQGDMRVITRARYLQLKQTRPPLVRDLDDTDAAAAPSVRPIQPEGQKAAPKGPLTAAAIRSQKRDKLQQEENPKPPKALAPVGSPIGAAKSPSSSPVAPASQKPTSTSRGRRGGNR